MKRPEGARHSAGHSGHNTNVPLRIGFDLDGVLADFAGAYRAIDERLHGPAPGAARPGDPEDEAKTEEDGRRPPVNPRRRKDVVWRTIAATPDFWTTLKPIDPNGVAHIHELMLRHGWEVFFITQRPRTAGDTVQRQSQRWLAQQGFDLPSVLVVPASRGAAAAALSLDYHVDDSPKNCIDVKAESKARPLLIADASDETVADGARRLGIGIAANISEALDVLDKATKARVDPSLLEQVAKLMGWV